MHKVRKPRVLATVRELWYARDQIAQERDVSPGRVVPDAALVAIAMASPRSTSDLPSSPRSVPRYGRQWLAAVERARDLSDDDLPAASVKGDGPPPQRSWADRNPLAAARLTATRERLAAFGEEHSIPVENVCAPDPLRRVVWAPPAEHDELSFAAALATHGVRSCPAPLRTSSSSTGSVPRSARPVRRASTPRPAPTTWSSVHP
jgi:ribonuclease D